METTSTTQPTVDPAERISRNLRSAATFAGMAGEAVREGDYDKAETAAKVSLAWSAVASATILAQDVQP